MSRNLNIGFISTRFAGTDGVTLEAEKWADVFRSFGHRCFWFAGVLDTPEEESHCFPEAFFNTPENIALNRRIYGLQQRSREVTDEIYRQKERIKDAILEFLSRFSIDLVIAENCLSIPMQIPLAVALTEVIAETRILTIGHHHDFWWERSRFLVNAVRDVLQSSFPPDLPSIRHVVINSLMQADLAAKRGISSTVVFNVVDFDSKVPTVDEYNRDFREAFGFSESDILILQPTRVVSRKGIEHALFLVKRLEMPEAHLIVSHSPDDEGTDYVDWIVETARQQNVPLHLLHNRLQQKRSVSQSGEKLYSLWDVYPHANLVTYPSLYEGFGNAFLEAVYYRKPILVNRYSVYITDIEPKDFEVIAIDGFLTSDAVAKVRNVLTNPDLRREMVEKNFEIGRKFFSLNVLRRRLGSLLSSFYGEFD